YHGILLCIERLLRIGRSGDSPRGLFYLARVALTFVAISLGWVLFRAQSFAAAAFVYREIFAGGGFGWALSTWQTELGIGLIAFALAYCLAKQMGLRFAWVDLPPAIRAGTLVALALAIELFSWPGTPVTFIYFRF
ncbi:MAG: hypothetical protein JOY69_03080, partial [Candidatus Eremiobacteraeota bacterium]|nr:hypothetical protein [Candidatus Eremiobacteraeota bacterium]